MKRGRNTVIGEEEIETMLRIANDGLRNPANQHSVPLLLLVSVCDLGVDLITIQKLREVLADSTLTIGEAFAEILKNWVRRNEQATVNDLTTILSSNGLMSLSDLINDEFPLNPFDYDQYEGDEEPIIPAVVLDQIFRTLDFPDQHNFRLVNRDWHDKTLRYWRQTKTIKIYGSVLNRSYGEVSIERFVRLLQNPENLLTEKKNPYHRYRIRGGIDSPLEKIDERQLDFWTICGPNMTRLELYDYRNDHIKTDVYCLIEWLLLKKCPNIVELTVTNCETYAIDLKQRKKFRKGLPAKAVAKNLRALHWSSKGNPAESTIIIRKAAKLNELTITNENTLTELLKPTVDGSCIKLKKIVLKVHYSFDSESNLYTFLPLRQYISKFPDSLEHLTIDCVHLRRSARVHPYNLYDALCQCTNLKVLQLVFTSDFEDYAEVDSIWFTDFTNISFPQLTKLELRFSLMQSCPKRFDFNAIGGMPKLEELLINFKQFSSRSLERVQNAIDNWIFTGFMIPYLPDDKAENIGWELTQCVTLKKLKLEDGWCLNANDGALINGWFPNLEYLECLVTKSGLIKLLESCVNLKKIVLFYNSKVNFFSLGELAKIHENVKMFWVHKDYAMMEILPMENGKVSLLVKEVYRTEESDYDSDF